MYKKVLLAYDGSVEGRRALREGAKLAQFCGAEVFLLAVVEISSGTVTLATPIANGATLDVRFLVGIQQTGSFKFYLNVEALP